MPPQQAFTLLMAALDDRQRDSLLGKNGIGINDLTTPAQKQLFEALLPDAQISAKPRSAGNEKPVPLGNLREKTSSVRLRMAQEISLRADVKGNKFARATIPPLNGAASRFYDLSSNRVYTHLEKVNGVLIRRDVPNRLKPSDLNYNAPALQAAISISDLKTVGDLIKSVAKQTAIELYCDPCYEKQTLTWVASGRTASASELLRALAFCVAGTYRRVGTAFTLTEDLIGVGTRRQMIHDFEEECEAERHQAVHEAEKKIKANPSQKNWQIGGFNDPLAMTAEQEKAPSETDNYLNYFIDGYDSLGSASLPFDQLTPTQQQAVQRFQKAQANRKPTTQPRPEPDFEKNIHVLKRLSAQMLIFGLDGVVSTDFGAKLNGLFQPEPPPYKTPESELAHYRNLPNWKDAAKAYSRRAVICKPHTTADVDASLVRIAALGFNQMWLTVFENGKARLPGTSFPLDPACDPKTDLLTYAIAEGKKKGITVCPVICAFQWGADAPAEIQLRTLRGENSAQSARRRFAINSLTSDTIKTPLLLKLALAPPPSNVWVDPMAPETQAALAGLFRAIRGHADAGACVCRDLTPSGLSDQDTVFNSSFFASRCANMGYNPSLRLAFLRKNHCDPIDIFHSFHDETSRANTSLQQYTQNGESMEQLWRQFCARNLQMALHSMLEPLTQNARANSPGLLLERVSPGYLISWFDIVRDAKTPFADADLYWGTAIAPDDAKTIAPPGLPVGIFLLSKDAPHYLPDELRDADVLSIEINAMKGFRLKRIWDGILIEE